MKKTLIAVLAIAMAIVLFSTVMAAPKSGGTVIYGELGDNETLNPILSENSSETRVIQCIFSSLYRTDQDTDFVLDLLAKWPTQKGLTYSYELKKGVLFSDGHELNSHDVQFTWQTVMNDKVAVPSRDGWDKITAIKVIDKYRFSVTLKEVYARYDLLWANTAIIPKHIIEKEMAANGGKLEKGGAFSRNPVGSGPFMLKEWKTDQYTLLVPNPKYFRKGQPYLSQVIFKVVPDSNVLVNQLRTGEIDATEIQAAKYNETIKIQGIKVYKDPAYIYAYIMCNFNDPTDLTKPHPILSDVRVRQALDYGYPRELIVDQVLDGLGYAAYSYLPPISWAYNAAVNKPHFDQAKAKTLLDQAGWVPGPDGIRVKNGKKLQLTVNTNAGNKTREAIEQVCQEYWKQIGVDLIIKNVDANTLFGDIMDNRKFDLLIGGWISDADPDGNTLFNSAQIPSKDNEMSGQNYMGYKNPEMDKLMESGLKTNDQAKRKEIYFKAQEILTVDVPYIYTHFYVKLTAVREGVMNYKPNPTTATDTWNVYEWYRAR